MFLTQGVPPPDNYPSCWGRLPCHHVELQEVQRLIHGAIRELLQDVKRKILHNKRKHQLSDSWFQSEPWSSISKDIINWKLISCNSLKETISAFDMYREPKFCGKYIRYLLVPSYIYKKSCSVIYAGRCMSLLDQLACYTTMTSDMRAKLCLLSRFQVSQVMSVSSKIS